MKPRVYFVSPQYTTPDEPHSGYYFSVNDEAGDDCICGPFSSVDEAKEAMEEAMDELS